MSFLGSIFTWWNGATIGTMLFSARNGNCVGEDDFGNRYFASKKDGRRWVIYNGSNDSSRVTPEWHGWLHGTYDALPQDILPPKRAWEKEATGNLTGTPKAHRPAGALEMGGKRASATGDYESWSPEN